MTNSIFSFDPESPHLLAHFANYFEYLIKRFNAFDFADPEQGINIFITKTQSLDFQQPRPDQLQLIVVHSINYFFYFELLILVKKVDGQFLAEIKFKEIIKENLELESFESFEASKIFAISENSLEIQLCRFTFAFLEGLILKQLRFSLLNQIELDMLDFESKDSEICKPKIFQFVYYLPKNILETSIKTSRSRLRRNRILVGEEERAELIQRLLDMEIEIISVKEDLSHFFERITSASDYLQVLRLNKDKNGDLIRIQDDMLDRLFDKFEKLKLVIYDRQSHIHDVIFEYMEDLKKNKDRHSEDDDKLLKRLLTAKNSFFEFFGELEAFTGENLRKPVDLNNDLDEFVQKDIRFPNVKILNQDMNELRASFKKETSGLTGWSMNSMDDNIKVETRAMIDEYDIKLKKSVLFPEQKKFIEFVIFSEDESANNSAEKDLMPFRKQALEELEEKLQTAEKPISKTGQVIFFRKEELDIEPKYDGSLKIEGGNSEEEDNPFKDDSDQEHKTVVIEKINDLRTSDNDLLNMDRQPCENVFENAPIFVWDEYMSSKPKQLKRVTPLASLTRGFKVNLVEDLKVKVIYDSKIAKEVRDINPNSGAVVRKNINLMTENLQLPEKKLQEMQDWLVSIVETLETNEEVRILNPHLKIYSDYSIFVSFEGLTLVESAKKLYEIMNRESESELEVLVEMDKQRETHYFLLEDQRLMLAARVKSAVEEGVLRNEIHLVAGQNQKTR